jgi:glycosyltransferase involved in cell wall biosynthesis
MSKSLKIDIICNDGSPIGVSEASIDGRDGSIGVGGAELGLLTLCAGWHNSGHHVTLYNTPRVPKGSIFPQKPLNLFSPNEDRDILIIFRSPNHRALKAKGKKIWFSTDQYTVGDFRDFSYQVDRIVTISNFHAEYFNNVYGISNTVTIDLPVRTWEYSEPIEKVKNKLIFCSVPDRGLHILTDVYDVLKKNLPDISLTITSDYRLWGVSSPLNERYISRFIGKEGVRFLGAVSRSQLIQEQLSSEIHSYPCTYDELFCYAVAECQVAGNYPITSTKGALPTTNMGKLLSGEVTSMEWRNLFVESIIQTLTNRKAMQEEAKDIQQRAIKRFALKDILKIWDERVFYV